MTHTRVSSDRDDLLGQVVNEFFESVALGETPDIADYLRRYPEIADLLKVAIPAMKAAQGAASQSNFTPNQHTNSPEGQLGDFRILRQLGRGGMGVVYEAEQISMKRRVALKVLPLAGLVDELKIQRFQNEVRAVAALDHPNIVSVYMVGEERGVHYYAMQLIRGRTLAEVITSLRQVQTEGEALTGESVSQVTMRGQSGSGAADRDGETPTELFAGRSNQPAQSARLETVAEADSSTIPHATRREYFRSVAALGTQAATALQHAHDRGIIHRDIKPANLMLDQHSQLFVTDFGLARMEADAGVTMTGDLIGTLRYMAPEQALAKRVVVDQRADIYSLAVTLYELLALRPAYPGEDRQQLLKQIAFEEPTSLRRIDPTIPSELETIVQKAMSKDMDERYSLAQELGDDLKLFLDNRPIKAKPPTLAQIVSKWTKRNPAIAWASVVTLVLVTIAFGISTLLVAKQRDREVRVSNRLRTTLYARELGAAYQAWSRGNSLRSHQLLSRQIPDETNRDLRGLEWYYLASRCKANRGEVIVEGKQGPWSISPDERLLATKVDGEVVVIDLVNRHRSVLVEKASEPNDRRVAFSPDGRLAMTTPDGVRVVNLSTKESLDVSGDGSAWNITFSPDGKWGAHGPENGEVRLWDAKTGRVAWSKLAKGHIVYDFSPDAKWLVTRAWEVNDLTIWDVADGRKQTISLDDTFEFIQQTAFVSDETFILAGGFGVRLINLVSGQPVDESMFWLPSTQYISSIALSDDKTRLLIGTESNAVEVWDLTAEELLWRQVRPQRVGQVQFLNEASQVVLGTDSVVEICNIEDTAVARLGRETRLDWPQCIAVHGNEVAVPAPDYEIVVWNTTNGTSRTFDFKNDIGAIEKPSKTWVATLAYSPDGSKLASAGAGWDDHTIRIWDAKSGRLIDRYRMEQSVYRVAYSPDGRRLAAVTEQGVTLWDTTTSKVQWVGPDLEGDAVSVLFSPDEKWLIVGAGPWRDGGRLSVWDIQGTTPELVKDFDHEEIVLVLAVSHDSRWLAAGDHTGRTVVHDLQELDTPVELAGHTMALQALEFSQDGRTLVSGAYDGTVKFWQVETWQELGELHELDRVGALRLISTSSKGLGLLIGRGRAHGPADLRVHWIDSSSDWAWLGHYSQD